MSSNSPAKKPRKSTLPIYERRAADGRLLGYQVRIRRAGHPAVSQQFDRRDDAEEFAVNTLAELGKPGGSADVRARQAVDGVTLGEALLRYSEEITPAKRSADRERTQIERLRKTDIAARFLTDLRGPDLARFRDKRLENLSPTSVRLELALLSHLFNTARKEWGWPVGNPIADISRPAPARGRTRRLEDGEEVRLLDACEASRSVYLAPAVRLALATAARQGELLDLQWSDVNFTSKTALFRDTKRRDSYGRPMDREIPLSRAAIDALAFLRDHRSNASPDAVFPIGQMSLIHAFQRACVRAEIKELRFHDLRHEATSRLFERGLDIMTVRAITGHSTGQMLARYTHLRAADLVRLLDDDSGEK